MGTIRATDDEQLARQLWGENCEWDEERRQYVPVVAKPEEPEQDVAAEARSERYRRRTARRAEAEGEA